MTSLIKSFFYLCILGIGGYVLFQKKSEHGYNVAITQIASHPSLEKIRSGIEDTFKKELKKNVTFNFQNAQGNMILASQIAQKFVSLKPNVIIPITTPSAQAVYSVAKETDIPIVFSAISDPETAKLTYAKNLTGVQDEIPSKDHLELIKKLTPQIKRIGILYNPSEMNSVSMVKKLKDASTNYEFCEACLINSQSILETVSSLAKKVDAIYIPNDNMAISNFETIARVVREYNIPIFTSDPDSVKRGALASISADQYEIGVQTAYLALRVLKKQKMFPIEKVSKFVTSINMKMAKKFKINIPKDLKYKPY